MSEIPDDGGPAFPVSIPGCGDNGWSGMSLRDYFAGLAMRAVYGNPAAGGDEAIASYAYKMADAMMQARKS